MLNRKKKISFVVTPLPITNVARITLSAPAHNATVEIIDALGSVLRKENIADDTLTLVLATDDMPCGTYFIRLTMDGKAAVQRVFVKK